MQLSVVKADGTSRLNPMVLPRLFCLFSSKVERMLYLELEGATVRHLVKSDLVP